MDDMRMHFFEAVEVLIPYEKAMFYLVDDEANKIKLKDPIFINVDERFAKTYEIVVEKFHYGRVAMSTRRTMSFNDSEMLEGKQRESSDMYMAFMKPNNIPFGAGIIIADQGKVTAEISFFRTDKQGDFTSREMKILDILKDHLEIRINGAVESQNENTQKKTKLIDSGLTQREIEIAGLVHLGKSADEISEDLDISKFTVRRHLHNVYSKLDISGRMELISLMNKM
ncbi:MAG TPA: helix-turn-helix transcriptional regulator [Bacillota bacterium]|nr:helix-turn-helix transcriptional regulator [Bacillota bacterium]